ncbi:hypothetical protein [Pantoea sp. Cy-639]|uniref:hypothetical protein n=1 Tax=Pantoea sp. Cy-639 TaxID=2608360 RepID=UPI00141FF0E1|nr:hypothetical protein [Pantoea sp. Cy-639]NIF19975.1 hypothetical protein [Pantoea sp. Cy-639]
MFEDYLDNPETYHRLEARFLEIFFEEVARCGFKKDVFKCPHYNARFANGTPFMDANPIFSASHRITGNIIRVVICEGVSDYSINKNKIDDGVELCLIIKLSHVKRTRREIHSWIKSQRAG